MIHLGRGIAAKRDVFSSKECQSLIAICDDERSLKIINNSSNSQNKYEDGTSFTDIKLTLSNAPNLQKFIHKHICDAVQEYCEFQQIPFLGNKYDIPELMKFKVGQDKFKTHFDGNGSDSSRTLALIWYLNDVEVGGELHLPSPKESLVIKPELGKLVIVPTDWTHYHYVTTPISNSRYSLITFIRY
ncbi:MAG: hypothetical protein ACI92O_000331 [Colwellia sp.]